MEATADHAGASAEAVGIDSDIPRAVKNGHGSEAWTRTIDSIRHGGANM